MDTWEKHFLKANHQFFYWGIILSFSLIVHLLIIQQLPVPNTQLPQQQNKTIRINILPAAIVKEAEVIAPRVEPVIRQRIDNSIEPVIKTVIEPVIKPLKSATDILPESEKTEVPSIATPKAIRKATPNQKPQKPKTTVRTVSQPENQNNQQALVNHSPQPLISSTHTKPLTDWKASISSAIEELVEEIEKTDDISTHTPVFDPRMKEAIAKAQKSLKNAQQYRAKYARQKKFQVVAKSGDSVTIRVGDRCLNLPRAAAYDPDNLRIISQAMNCPPQDKIEWFQE